MKIYWAFDEEPEWDPFTLLGQISITGDQESEIRDDCIILDMWFLALFEGIESLSQGLSKEVDLVDEPDPLRFMAREHRFEIHYQEKVVFFSDIHQALAELKEVVGQFVNVLLEYPAPRDEAAIRELARIAGIGSA